MERGVRLVLAGSVLLSGISVAMMHRRQLPQPSREQSVSIGPAVLRQWTGPSPPQANTPTPWAQPPKATQVPVASPRRAMIAATLDATQPPPQLARAYPGRGSSLDAMDTTPLDYRLPAPSDSRPATRIHKIVDGDTLEALAERYLGSVDRADEIFEANRELLSDPKVLPIGVELRIPPRRATATPESPAAPAGPLVPVVESPKATS